MFNITNQGNANQNHNDHNANGMATITQKITSTGSFVEKLERLCAVGENLK